MRGYFRGGHHRFAISLLPALIGLFLHWDMPGAAPAFASPTRTPLGTPQSTDTIYAVSFVGGLKQIVSYSISGGEVVGTSAIGDDNPVGVAADSSGNVYTANLGNDTISVYAPASGGGTPVRKALIGGPATGIRIPVSVALDQKGNIYVLSQGTDSIQVFAPGSNGTSHR